MRVVMGCDHGGVELKEQIRMFLEKEGYSVKDMGISQGEAVDYPDIAALTCREYLKGEYRFGVLLCGTGIGVSMAANKIKGIRCALLYDQYTARMAREHNNANFIAFGGRVSYPVPVEEIIRAFLGAEFGGQRHTRRVAKIMDLDTA